jgi:hypothetical protein
MDCSNESVATSWMVVLIVCLQICERFRLGHRDAFWHWGWRGGVTITIASASGE